MEGTDHVVFKTKLQPPMVEGEVLFRSSVIRRLKKAKERPLTVVQAGPGFGKSTAISAFLRMEPHPYVWYTVTEQDNQLFRFLLYFKETIQKIVPAIDTNWITELILQIEQGNEKGIYECCSHFINACVDIDEDWLFIMDDYQIVSENKEIDQFMKWFLMHLPQRLHMILVSRSKLDWHFLASWRVKGYVNEVREKDLCFSAEEIQILFEDHYRRPLSMKEGEYIFAKTEGWIMAIQMVWQQMEEGLTLEEIFRDQTSSMEELFDYLAYDVLQRQPQKTRQFLKEASIFSQLTVEVCERVMELSNGEELIADLMKRHLFLQTTEDKEVFRFHSLFQQFLQNRLKLDWDRWCELHVRAAEVYVSKGLLDQGLFHMKECCSSEVLAEYLFKHGKNLIKQGYWKALEHALGMVDDAHKDRFSRLWIVQGDVERYQSQYERALVYYRRAMELGEKNGDALSESMALEGAACVYLDTIQPRQGHALLKRAIDLLEQSSSYGLLDRAYYDEVQKQLRHLYVLMSENTINLGDANEARKWYEKSRSLEEEEGMEDLEARLHLRTGRLGEMVRRLEKRKVESQGDNATSGPPKSHRERDLLLSYVYALLGREKKAKDAASSAIMQGVRAEAPFVEACGWIRMGHAVLLQDKYEQRLASTCYETALQMMEEMNISRGKAEPYMGLSLLYGKRRELEPAIKFATLGLVETDRVDDRWLSTWIHVCKAIAYIYAHKEEMALSELNQCFKQFQLCGDSYGLTVTMLWQSYVTYQMGDEAKFYPYVHQFLQLVEKGGYHELLQTTSLFGPMDVQQLSPMLLDAYHSRKKEQPYLHHLMLQLGMDKGVTSHPGYTLRIQTFKEFKVFRGEEEITERDWKRGKAKELLQLFVTKRKHLLQKEEIYDLLWSGQEEEVASRDFKVALNMLNKVLEPERKARTTPFFIQRHERAYGLNLAAPFELDTYDFESGVLAGLEAKDKEEGIRLLTEALQLYEGDYLPERIHDDWCIEERERLQVLFLRGSERLAMLYLDVEEEDLCIESAQRILERDRCWEEAYRLLMEAYHRKGNRNMVFQYYEKCCEVLEKELGILPMEKTRLLYEKTRVGGDFIDRSGA
ncbi:BTAD domain-containing putative transcriptional regulator [Evansella sp. AB-P1]|uniref:BTAD domain-containing putative transcriptional regulator n=1 Tax=Evansella sp. AB-P1 TaxID=3037653 RepID=UPI002420184A|nr:BTAD domain-containing putative transcriptional regulator [Evansella sp. AB-P1]MDG5787433.1 BTAD domain-containing putative transcriptional regulator [Evansella sp. AB-P1]